MNSLRLCAMPLKIFKHRRRQKKPPFVQPFRPNYASAAHYPTRASPGKAFQLPEDAFALKL
jgi:hypothetical protein